MICNSLNRPIKIRQNSIGLHSLADRRTRHCIFDRWQPSRVFDTFWIFAAERQAIFFRRLAGLPPPWTTDRVLATFKFTNAYRASDRASQFLIRHVIYKGDPAPREVFFRTILFKFFNRIDTWLLLTRTFGDICSSISLQKIDTLLTTAMQEDLRIYSGAYIMPAGADRFKTERKHSAHLQLLELMLRDEVPKKITDCKHMGDVFRILRSYPMLGDFLAYQYAIDLNYSELTHFSESEFVMPGPGAKSGLRKCFRQVKDSDEIDIIKAVADHQDIEFGARELAFERLGDRPLQLIDCQNLFCEIDKYARVAHPDVRTPSSRTKIKQKFAPQLADIDYWYPPKWGINQQLKSVSRRGESELLEGRPVQGSKP
jgi:hypothetical protein